MTETPEQDIWYTRVQQLEAERDEFNAGWKSCIEDLRKSAEICRAAENKVQQLEQRIAELEGIIGGLNDALNGRVKSLKQVEVEIHESEEG